jgi:riboflavin kinase/FMN adenylyltransferase
VYAVRVRLNGKRRGGVLNIGLRPTFGAANEPTIEVHVFDFNRRIYGRTIEVEFVKKLRNELRFADRHSLIRQIAKDEIRAKRALALSSLAAF